MKELVTPKQVANALGVSEASLKRWCDKGLLPVTRTAGGHRRLPIDGVMSFLRASGRELVHPEVLGLPPATGKSPAATNRTRQLFREALEKGDEEACRRLVVNLYLSGHKVSDICDDVIAPAFHDIGDRWEHGETEVYEERRAVELSTRLLFELRSLLPRPGQAAPGAIGGTLQDDPYTLPTKMVELALHEAGWRAQSLGIGHPADTLETAIERIRPRLFWLSVSTMRDAASFVEAYGKLSASAEHTGVAIVVGGRALAPEIRQRIRYASYCDRLGHLIAFANAIRSTSSGRGGDGGA